MVALGTRKRQQWPSRPRSCILGAVVLVAFLGSSSIASTSAISLERAQSVDVTNLESTLVKRHGDDEHDDHDDHNDHEVEHVGMSMEHITSLPELQSPSTTVNYDQHEEDHLHSDEEMKSTSHSHGHDSHNHDHSHMGSSLAFIPDPLLQSKDTFIPVPPLPEGVGGHSHGGHGAELPKLELNETVILQWKGPEPLSYIEWDFSYGIGKSQDLLRFSQSYEDVSNVKVMGVGGERWRTLVDENDASMRMLIASDIRQRMKADKEDPGRHRTLMTLHIAGCIFSCFVLLPIALALRAAASNLAPLASLIYLIFLSGSLLMSQLYKAMTPRLYPSNSHGGLGYAIYWISVIALGSDVFKLLLQIVRIVKGSRKSSKKMSLRTFMQAISLSTTKASPASYDPLEEEMMLSPEDGESDAPEVVERIRHPKRSHSASKSTSSSQSASHRVHFAAQEGSGMEQSQEIMWSNEGSTSNRVSRDIPSPTSTLCNTPRTSGFGELHHPIPAKGWPIHALGNHESPDERSNHDRVASWRQFGDAQRVNNPPLKDRRKTAKQIFASILRYSHVTVARSIPVLSFAAAYSGLAVYTGSCRGSYGNTCMAHGIKGGIFFWYGLLSFGRYLGAYADLGWAWNKQPSPSSSSSSKKGRVSSSAVSAEWVECLVIFIYGSTNTWMERFGAAPGDPYSVKQVQHISIAVMFWFAGSVGLILETKSLRNLLAIPVALKQASIDSGANNENESSSHSQHISCEEAMAVPARQPSYNFSFNPFPALVIGVTGVAMAAHHQEYVYEVSIHQLWGNLLAGFSFFRILTYFFLFLRPPTSSIMPSRPPTEALASFCLASGGIVFMLSSEEVSFVAMRNGFGDFMMILNLTVAIVSFVFCAIAGLMILKAYAVQRENRRQQVSSSIRLEDHHHRQLNRVGIDVSQNQAVYVVADEEDEVEEEEEKLPLSSSPVAI